MGTSLPRRLSWTTLLALLVGVCFFSPFFERQGGQRLVGESTLLMAAESLAWDGDLRYDREDFDRHVLTWLQEPPDLALVTGDTGRHWAYDVSPAAALWLAPFVRWWPNQGFAVANCLLLLLVGVVVAAHWQRRRGVLGPLTLAVCVGASLVLGTLFVADGGFFHFAATLLGFTLLARPFVDGRRDWPAWGAGALLALPVAAVALHGWLAVAALWMADSRRRRTLILSFSGMLMALVWVQNWQAGGGGPLDRHVFGTASGFPLVDFEGPEDLKRAGWEPNVPADRLDGAEAVGGRLNLSTRAWAMMDRLVGRHLGIVLFFPLVLPLAWGAWRVRRRRPLLWTGAASLLTGVAVSPQDVELGGILWAGGVWLPVYGAWVASLGWVASRDDDVADRSAAWWSWPGLVTVVLAAALAIWTLPVVWRDPWRVSTSLSQSMQTSPWPLETTQERVSGGDRLVIGDLTWVQLDDSTWVEAQNRRLILPADRASDWLLVSEQRLDEEGPVHEALEHLLNSRQVLGLPESFGIHDVPIRRGVSIRATVESMWPRRHHVGWTQRPQWLYRLRLHPVVEPEHADLAYLALQEPTQ